VIKYFLKHWNLQTIFTIYCYPIQTKKYKLMKKVIYPIATVIFLLTIVSHFQVFATKHIVNVQNFSFSPANISNVQLGDTIRWVWISGTHTTTSTTIPAGAAIWDNPITSTNTSFEYKVIVAGTFNYKCTPHSSMGMIGSFTAVAAATLSVLPPNQNVSAAAGNTAFSVTSNSNWNTSSNSAWCTVTPSGSGNGSIIAAFTMNSSTSPRTAIVTITVAGVPSQTVTVSQAGAAATLAVAPPNRDVSPLSGITTFSVTSNSNWTASCNSSWCTVTPSGSGNGTIEANYDQNTSISQRIAVISVVVSGVPTQSVTITQASAERTLSVTPPNQNVEAAAGITTFSVLSNSAWTAISDVSWCSVTPSGTGDGTIQAIYEENPDNTPRIATLSIVVAGLPVQTVTVNQSLSTVSVNEINPTGFQLFPNPSKGIVEIEFLEIKAEITHISLISLNGKTILEKSYNGITPFILDASSLPKGIYIVKLETTNNQYIQLLTLVD
jgi:plastocyanin